MQVEGEKTLPDERRQSMATFPTYRGQQDIPKSLSLFNPRHYLLLFSWIIFRPLALKRYLYDAAPERYRTTNTTEGVEQCSKLPAYRNALFMAFVLALLIALPTSPLMAAIINVAQGIPFEPQEILPIIKSALLGVVLGGIVIFFPLMLAKQSFAFGIMLMLLLSTVLGIGTGVTSGVDKVNIIPLFEMIIGMPGPLAAILASSFVVGVMFSLIRDGTSGIATNLFGIFLGFVFGVIFGGISLGHGWLGVMGMSGLLLFAGATRLPFSLFQLIPALRQGSQGKEHPVMHDELSLLPLPNTVPVLERRLAQDESDGIAVAADVARNPWQRWGAQRALHRYLHQHPQPLHFLTIMLRHPTLDEYLYVPHRETEWQHIPPLRVLLFAMLDHRYLPITTIAQANRQADQLVWWLTRPLRTATRTPLTRYAGMLADLLMPATTAGDADDAGDAGNTVRLSHYEEVYTALREYPGGEELASSYSTLATLLDATELSPIADAAPLIHAHLAAVNTVHVDDGIGEAIRPDVQVALAQLGEVAAAVADYQTNTDGKEQEIALERASALLVALDEHHLEQVMEPERGVMRQIICQWRLQVRGLCGIV